MKSFTQGYRSLVSGASGATGALTGRKGPEVESRYDDRYRPEADVRMVQPSSLRLTCT